MADDDDDDDDDTRSPRTAASRPSYFQEAPMQEYTPANSINEESFLDRRLRFWVDGEGKLVLRVANAVLHLGLCCVLLAIMVEFLVRYQGHKPRPPAIALITLVAVDCCVDIYAVARWRELWQAWAILLRLLLALGYMAQFLLYVGIRQVFPRRYAYWGIKAGYSESIVYFLLLALGIWNMLHTVVQRHTLGRGLRQYVVSLQARRHSRNQVNHGHEDGPRRASSGGDRQRTISPTNVEHGSDSEVTIALGEIRADDKSPTVPTSRVGSSYTSGGSSSRGGSTLHADSQRGTPRPSRSASASVLNVTGRAEGEADNIGVGAKI